jgi:hypothetical protein
MKRRANGQRVPRGYNLVSFLLALLALILLLWKSGII